MRPYVEFLDDNSTVIHTDKYWYFFDKKKDQTIEKEMDSSLETVEDMVYENIKISTNILYEKEADPTDIKYAYETIIHGAKYLYDKGLKNTER